MASCVARNFFSTACRAIVSQSLARTNGFQFQKRAFSYSRCLTAARLFTPKHEWVLIEDGTGTVGISSFAQESLGDIVYVDLPEVGTDLAAGDIAGCVESVKAASDIYSPVDGTVTTVNAELEGSPDLVNKSPLGNGWLYKLTVSGGTDTSSLMDEAAYEKFCQQSD